MSAPNFAALTTTNAKTAVLDATTTMTDLIAAVATGHAIIVAALFATNVDSSAVGRLTVVLKRSGVEKYICRLKRVPNADMYNFLLGKQYHLEEGDSIRVQAGADNTITVHAPYTDAS